MALPAELREVAAGCGIDADSAAAGQLDAFVALLSKWNRRVNLTSSTRPADLAPLIEESLWAARLYRERKGGGQWRHLDIGTGSGFPAVPLKILNPGIRLTLLESREKKAFFLERVIRELGFAETAVCCRRLSEYLGETGSACWDTVSWKAVRLAEADWRWFLERSVRGVEFWVFHGRGIPAENPAEFRRRFGAVETLRIPNRKESYLSIFQ